MAANSTKSFVEKNHRGAAILIEREVRAKRIVGLSAMQAEIARRADEIIATRGGALVGSIRHTRTALIAEITTCVLARLGSAFIVR